MSQGYSAKVDLWFETEFGKVPLAQVGRGKIICRHPTAILAGEFGSLVVVVDGHETRRKVRVVSTREIDGRTVAVVEGVE